MNLPLSIPTVKDRAQDLIISHVDYRNSFPRFPSIVNLPFVRSYSLRKTVWKETLELGPSIICCFTSPILTTKVYRGSRIVQIASGKFRPCVGLCQSKKSEALPKVSTNCEILPNFQSMTGSPGSTVVSLASYPKARFSFLNLHLTSDPFP